MAEYYPLLAKAVSSLPNSTPDTRRVVYERARKALIGQLRTLHPPVPDEDIERESVALDKAIERLEGELAAAPPSSAPSAPSSAPPALAPKADERPAPPAGEAKKPSKPVAPPSSTSAIAKKPAPPLLRPRVPKPKDEPPASSGEAQPTGDARPGTDIAPIGAKPLTVPEPVAPKPVEPKPLEPKPLEPKLVDSKPTDLRPIEPKLVDTEPVVVTPGDKVTKPGSGDNDIKPRLEVQRPIAPQPPVAKGAKPRIWIIPAGIVIVIALVAGAAWKLRDRPETLARSKPVEQTQGDTGKIADRVGGSQGNAQDAPEPPAAPTPDDAAAAKPEQPETPQAAAPPADTTPAQPAPAQGTPPQPAPAAPQATPAATNPEVPVGYRAALLVEAPDETEKVKTYLGTVVWKLNNVNGGPGDAVGLGVEADIDIPTDGVKIVVTIEKNADASLPASHVIKVRFAVQPGSATGDVKRLSVPQMRREDVQTGVPLAGVSVPVLQNSFLVGLTPGNSESANLKLLGDFEWIDIPMLLSSGKIAKLTFDKGASGQRDIAEALAAWQKQ